MVEILKKIFFVRTNKADQIDDVADFFLRAKAGEKKAFFKKVIREANEDQRKYLETYEKNTTQ